MPQRPPPRCVGLARACVCALVLAFAALVAACESKGGGESRIELTSSAIGARLVPKGGSDVKGLILFRRREGGLTMVVSLADIMPGPYRIAIHTTGICSSPNTFSAGPPWTPAGLAVQVYPAAAGNNNLLTMTASMDGVAADGPNGILGKSVVVHQGLTGSLDARPGAPNDRIACGTIETIASHEF